LTKLSSGVTNRVPFVELAVQNWKESNSGWICLMTNKVCRGIWQIGYCHSYKQNLIGNDKFPCVSWSNSTRTVLERMESSWKSLIERSPFVKNNLTVWNWSAQQCAEYKAMQFSALQSQPFDDEMSSLTQTLPNC